MRSPADDDGDEVSRHRAGSQGHIAAQVRSQLSYVVDGGMCWQVSQGTHMAPLGVHPPPRGTLETVKIAPCSGPEHSRTVEDGGKGESITIHFDCCHRYHVRCPAASGSRAYVK